MKKYFTVFLFSLTCMVSNAMASGAVIIMNQNNNKVKEDKAVQSFAMLPTNASWAIIKNNDRIKFTNGGISFCEKGRKASWSNGLSSICEGEEKQLSVDEFVKMNLPDVKVIGMTPHFDRDANFVFMVVYYINK